MREYATGEDVSMIEAAGFRVVETYSIVNDLTLVDAESSV
jgi:hypothetical protein